MSNLIPSENLAPDVGALVNYGTDSFGKEPGRYRVTGYMCRVESKPDFGNDFLGEILFDSCRDFQGGKMRYCIREQATHVSLTGIAGAIAPIDECTVTGMVQWPDGLLKEAREKARRKGERGEMLF
ncbi:TPA: hypothetical protein QEM39_000359 [Pseudomonas putida]|uniref:hypothetical protein n=1 Tax=Pseudomonas putida TaxID=303 RepID=UPI0023637D25|nr:hypothetical protein [Pseudomonas putida]MDD2152300.1 hypothetical protein [Pseudomonas putida]HDS1678891.1 hypothetical protein [Pseudomonas putida]